MKPLIFFIVIGATFASVARADSCVIDMKMANKKSRECWTNISTAPEKFQSLCTVTGEQMKKVMTGFDYRVSYQSVCPSGWVGYCDWKTHKGFFYARDKAVQIKKVCKAKNQATWHTR